MSTPFLGIPPFSGVSNVTPFTYKDGETYLGQLRRLRDYTSDGFAVLSQNDSITSADIATLQSYITSALNTLETKLESEIATLSDGGPLVFDPTTGQRTVTASVALGHVYDNNRVYGLFASQIDALGLTAAQFDALNYAARQFDLAATYPELNAVNHVLVHPLNSSDDDI